MIPELVAVDERSGHRAFVARQQVNLERGFGDPERGTPKAVLASRLETEPRVVGRRAFEKHHRNAAIRHLREPVTNQRRADPLALVGGQHAHGAEHLDVDEPRRGVEKVPLKSTLPTTSPSCSATSERPGSVASDRRRSSKRAATTSP